MLVNHRGRFLFCNLLSFLLRFGTGPYEWGSQWDSNSLVKVCLSSLPAFTHPRRPRTSVFFSLYTPSIIKNVFSQRSFSPGAIQSTFRKNICLVKNIKKKIHSLVKVIRIQGSFVWFLSINYLHSYNTYISLIMKPHIYIYIYIYSPTPPHGQDVTQGQFVSRVRQLWNQGFPSPTLVV